MIKFLVFISVIFSSIAFAKDDITIPFTEENAKYWQYISDQTMGGISNGQAILDKDGDMSVSYTHLTLPTSYAV